jgi:Spy/CpxP family protein refolding chaperone
MMKNLKWKTATALSLLFVFAFALTVNAQQGRRPRVFSGGAFIDEMGVRGFIQGLRITDDQRAQIKTILQAHRTDILNNRLDLLSARLEILKDDSKGTADFGAAQAKLNDMRVHILNEIKAKLTPDQLSLLQDRQQRRINALQLQLNRLQNQGTR